jgi:methionine synthase I (cobalamin-dependent)
VADTIGILNKFSNTDKMCLFLDFDDKCNIEKIITQVIPELISDGLDYILFETSSNHHNIICPTLITKDQLDALMMKYLKYMDYRFAYVYQRDNCNAIRITPKLVDGKMLRQIKIIASGFNAYNQPCHKGILELISDVFENDFWGTFIKTDDSTKDDLIERRYETINW